MRCLVLAHERDLTAIAVAHRLRARHGNGAVMLRSVGEIVFAPHWRHEVHDTGAETDVEFHDGTSLSAFQATVVFNRLLASDVPAYVGTSEADREYGRAEWHALLLSWLASIKVPVVNAPTPLSLCGGGFRIGAWYALATRAGLAVTPLHATTRARELAMPRSYEVRRDLHGAHRAQPRMPADDMGWFAPQATAPARVVDVIGDEVIGAPTHQLGDACRRFAELAAVRLVQLAFNGDRFHSATTLPEYGDARRIHAIARLLEACEA